MKILEEITECRCRWCSFWRVQNLTPTAPNLGLKRMQQEDYNEWVRRGRKPRGK